jgi:hypothetical protein
MSLLVLLSHVDVIAYLRVPADWRVAPPGYASFFHLIPWDESLAVWIHRCAYLFAIMLGVGWFTRTSCIMAMLLSLYVLGVPNFFGGIGHGSHHIIWFLALLAASPSGAVLSVDNWMRRRRGERRVFEPSQIYALPIRFAWLLLGVIYLFPGLAKASSGPAWFLSDNMRLNLYQKWLSHDFLPVFRVDLVPGLCEFIGATTIAFEVLFIVLIFFPHIRPWAVLCGFMFHLTIRYFMHIGFLELLICYVVFVDWHALYGRLRGKRAGVEGGVAYRSDGFKRAVVPVGAFLLLMNLLCGVLIVDSWPFTIYPRFKRIKVESKSVYSEVLLYDDTGNVRVIEPLVRAKVWNRLRSRHPELREHLMLSMPEFLRNRGVALPPGYRLELHALTRSTLPEDHDRDPLERSLLLAVTEDGIAR